jgi:hypothetical protein
MCSGPFPPGCSPPVLPPFPISLLSCFPTKLCPPALVGWIALLLGSDGCGRIDAGAGDLGRAESRRRSNKIGVDFSDHTCRSLCTALDQNSVAILLQVCLLLRFSRFPLHCIVTPSPIANLHTYMWLRPFEGML